MPGLLTCKFEEDPIKTEGAISRTHLKTLLVYGIFWLPNILCSKSLKPTILHAKFDQDWPTGFGDINA